jgi:hypothetical protein
MVCLLDNAVGSDLRARVLKARAKVPLESGQQARVILVELDRRMSMKMVSVEQLE